RRNFLSRLRTGIATEKFLHGFPGGFALMYDFANDPGKRRMHAETVSTCAITQCSRSSVDNPTARIHEFFNGFARPDPFPSDASPAETNITRQHEIARPAQPAERLGRPSKRRAKTDLLRQSPRYTRSLGIVSQASTPTRSRRNGVYIFQS